MISSIQLFYPVFAMILLSFLVMFIKKKKYYTNNEINGNIYIIEKDGDVGNKIGSFINKKLCWL